MQTKLVAAAAAALLLALPAAAGSGGLVTVTLAVDASTEDTLAWGYTPFSTACAVTVPEGADGAAVLEAAVASGCIDSWSADTYDFGTFVACVDATCGEALDPLYFTLSSYWKMSENGATTSYGLDLFQAAEGDVLAFSYTTTATWLAVELP